MERLKTAHDRVKEREVGNVEEEWKHMKDDVTGDECRKGM